MPNQPKKQYMNCSKIFICPYLTSFFRGILTLVSFSFLMVETPLDATVQGGALLNGSTFSDNNATLTYTARALKWSDSNLDDTVFEFNSSNPTRLKVKSAGDYFIAFTGHVVESATAVADKRTQSEFVLRKNGSEVDYGASRCSFIRHSNNHSETSGHIHVFLPGLAANDYLEIFSKLSYNEGNYVDISTSRLFAEKVSAARTVFSAVSTRAQSHATLSLIHI